MSEEATIMIVKKKKGGGGDGHHGGAWKVAYADFVTAMMAFFLLMWLLSSTSEDQRKGIADYFAPSIPISDTSSGGASLFGGESVVSASTMARDGSGGTSDAEGRGDGEQEGVSAPDPAKVDPFMKAVAHARAELEFQAALEAEQARAAQAQAEQAQAEQAQAEQAAAEAKARASGAEIIEGETARSEKNAVEPARNGAPDSLDKALEDGAVETADAARLGAEAPPSEAQSPDPRNFPDPQEFKVADREALEEALKDPSLSSQDRAAMVAAYEAIEAADKNGELLEHLAMRVTPEGLLIEIAETAKTPLFGSGSAEPSDVMVALMQAIAPAIAELKNRVAVVGHTDGRPFAPGSRRNNWTLSAERADAARRLLESAGLPPERLARISGSADRDPLSEDVYAPENRRIGLTLLRERSKRARPPAPADSGTPDATARPNGRDDAPEL